MICAFEAFCDPILDRRNGVAFVLYRSMSVEIYKDYKYTKKNYKEFC